MRFVPLSPRARQHDFGMHRTRGRCTGSGARFLDTIFCAGVGFDAAARDSAMARASTTARWPSGDFRRHWRGPRLVGLAYSFQVVPHIPVTANDVFMDLIVTDRGIDELLAHED